MATVNAHNGRWTPVPNASILATGSLVRMAGRRTYSSLYLALLDEPPSSSATSQGSNDFAELTLEGIDSQNYVVTPNAIPWSFHHKIGQTFGTAKDIHFRLHSGGDWEGLNELWWAIRVTENETVLHLAQPWEHKIVTGTTAGATRSIDIRKAKTDAAATHTLAAVNKVWNPKIERDEVQLTFRLATSAAFETAAAGNTLYVRSFSNFSDLSMLKSFTQAPCNTDDASLVIRADDPQRVTIERAPSGSQWAVTTDSNNVETLILEGISDVNNND